MTTPSAPFPNFRADPSLLSVKSATRLLIALVLTSVKLGGFNLIFIIVAKCFKDF